MKWSKTKTQKLTALAMMSALAFLLTLLFRILPIPAFMPAAPFLDYEPKDVIIVIGGFLFGPLSVVGMSVVVSFLEMPFSGTGLIGVIMNVLSTCAFACTAAFIYKRWRTLTGAAVGLTVGVIILTAVMVLWNYLLTPLYTTAPREVVVTMLLPVFLPFNLIKGTLNAALTIMLYKSVKTALDKSRLLPSDDAQTDEVQVKTVKVNIGALLVSALILITCILVILSWRGII